MKPDFNRRLIAGAVLAGTAMLTVACVSNNYPKDSNTKLPTFLDDATVKITFDESGCPKLAEPEDFSVFNSKRVIWQSVDKEGKVTHARYTIYFDPFRGKTLEAKRSDKGQIKSPNFDKDSPKTEDGVVYEYTIVGTDCKDKPLDPRFRLR